MLISNIIFFFPKIHQNCFYVWFFLIIKSIYFNKFCFDLWNVGEILLTIPSFSILNSLCIGSTKTILAIYIYIYINFYLNTYFYLFIQFCFLMLNLYDKIIKYFSWKISYKIIYNIMRLKVGQGTIRVTFWNLVIVSLYDSMGLR